MYDDRYLPYESAEPEYWRGERLRETEHGLGDDSRLLVQVLVDGRPVDAWSGPVRGTRWEEFATRFDLERRPEPQAAPTPPPAPTPLPVRVLQWLDTLVGGRDALLELTADATAPASPAPELSGRLAESYAEALTHLDRVCGSLFDDEVLARCETVLADAIAVASAQLQAVRANELAGGALWLVGKANGLFVGGVTQQTVQRELWLKRQLATCARVLEQSVGGVRLYDERRPAQMPDLRPVGNPALLTRATRRKVVRWRDEALAACERDVLPSGVES